MKDIKQDIDLLYDKYSERSVKFKEYFSDKIKANNLFQDSWSLFIHISEIDIYKSNILQDIDFFVTSNIEDCLEEEKKELIYEIYQKHIIKVSFDFSYTLEKILYENLLINTEILIQQGLPILRNKNLILIAPLIFSNAYWKKIIKHDLSLITDEDIIELTISDHLFSLTKLEETFGSNSSIWTKKFFSSQLRDINRAFNMKNNIFKFFDVSSFENKRTYLNQILSKNISIKSTRKKKKKSIEVFKIELNNPKNIRKIRKGLTYLIKKQNPDIIHKEAKSIARIISLDIFHTENPEISKPLNNMSINFNNKILMEFIFFLSKTEYIKKQKHSFPKIISNNISIDKRGFSYQNLYILAKEIKNNPELTFNGLTSPLALANEMKY
ncbi:hypothetical protein [uncultured Dokdonia sp.]|uniref:hypothetical protein n=1 Tax=uncultured Dokdonia sp. TaxID=575653 RepID=UPI002613BC46|nr:hypothetical protein [uncultured Dokdonia sp.]